MYQVTVRGFLAEDLAEDLARQIRNGAPESLTVEVGREQTVDSLREALQLALPADEAGLMTHTVVARALDLQREAS